MGQGDVRVICPMTIGGSFEAKTAALTGSVIVGANGSRRLEGSLAVDLRTLDTGIGLRNEHLREKYLEVNKGTGFDTATLSAIDLTGLSPVAPEGKGSSRFNDSAWRAKTVTGAVDVRRRAASSCEGIVSARPGGLRHRQAALPRDWRDQHCSSRSRLRRFTLSTMARTLFFLVATTLLASTGWAEPTFLAKQYTRCTACHYSPTGGLDGALCRLLSHRDGRHWARPRRCAASGRSHGEQASLYARLKRLGRCTSGLNAPRLRVVFQWHLT